ncbi:MAG: ADP-ribosylglycohydrolase family protein, partial [bacterium]
RPSYSFDVSCQGSVPEAITAFLESNSFEDAVRKAVSIGGDSDTIACITGGIAQAFYKEIPAEIILNVKKRLPPDMLGVLEKFTGEF